MIPIKADPDVVATIGKDRARAASHMAMMAEGVNTMRGPQATPLDRRSSNKTNSHPRD